jgi:hypothetical protein
VLAPLPLFGSGIPVPRLGSDGLEPVEEVPLAPDEDVPLRPDVAPAPDGDAPLIPDEPPPPLELDMPEVLTPSALAVALSSCPVACRFLDF